MDKDHLYHKKCITLRAKRISGDMKGREGFTLVELTVTILIAIILVTVAVQLFRRSVVDASKWTEAKSMMGTVASAIRAYVAEKEQVPPSGAFANWGVQLGFRAADFKGNYFTSDNITIDTVSYNPEDTPALQFKVKGESSMLSPSWCTLDHEGKWAWED